jgi:hypothetical protein
MRAPSPVGTPPGEEEAQERIGCRRGLIDPTGASTDLRDAQTPEGEVRFSNSDQRQEGHGQPRGVRRLAGENL